MEDRYLEIDQCVDRLVKDYNKVGTLYVAFDFDNTLFDFYNVGDSYPRIEDLLRFLKNNGFKLVLFSANTDKDLEDIAKYCKFSGYEPDYINETPVQKTKKPYYHILLDDRAGLCACYDVLIKTLNKLGFKYQYDVKKCLN